MRAFVGCSLRVLSLLLGGVVAGGVVVLSCLLLLLRIVSALCCRIRFSLGVVNVVCVLFIFYGNCGVGLAVVA